MAIQTEIWARDIAEAIFPANTFMAKSISDDGFVSNKTVHLPQAGAVPTVERNRTVFPAVAAGRTDTTSTYDIDEYTSTPSVIRDIEEIETSYDKRSSVLRDHTEELNKLIANWLQYHWGAVTGSAILRTTGGDRVAQVTGATGNRKKLTIDDIILAKALLDDMDMPEDGRVLLLPSFMYNDLLVDNKTTLLSWDITGEARMENGKLMNLLGFEIFKRGKLNVLSYTNAATPVKRTPDAATLVSANAAALFWHPDFVRRAKGEIKVYTDLDNPGYYGSIFSAMARMGGRQRYTDGRGVVAVVEAAGT
jgi:hypothetical protein